MTLQYTAPLDDMRFIMQDVFDVEKLWQSLPALAHVDMDTVSMILAEAGKFASEVVLPLNQSGDDESATYHGDGVVRVPAGFKQAYSQYAESGWIGLGGDVNYGGQGMPKTVTMLTEEMLLSANQSFSLYPNLTVGATLSLLAVADDEQKNTYLPKLYTGEWSGTMCLTEAHSGTDLGIIKTRAVPNADGSYAITGTKIFITGGEHDLTENIIHLVLAKTPNAPAGSKGISLFVVPKFMVNADGSLGERNAVSAGSIEHKMGIKASATCVMNFDGATGYMLGKENTGLAAMFVMMNYERVTMGLQGLGAMELAYQNAVIYTKDRTQGRSDTGVQAPDKAADPIIHHGDVRRMLLSAKTFAEASRCLAMYAARELDIAKFSDDDTDKARASAKVALITPIVKAFLTDRGLEAAVDCQQCFGGHGYIKEWGMEQIVRDVRISQIYEGTNGIQALDFIARKVIKDNGAALKSYLAEIEDVLESMPAHAIQSAAQQAVSDLKTLTDELLAKAKTDPALYNGVAVDYLQAAGYVSFAYMFCLIVKAVDDKAADDKAAYDKAGEFYTNKLTLATHFAERILPRYYAHANAVRAGNGALSAYVF
ncbi:MAG: acyl-CoA dehydrogenase family protein [Moraxella sp.]|nr:acyl-CoA dehydrogenase family protein [Moraxella sp.]